MNIKQKIVLWIGISLLLLLIVYPPYFDRVYYEFGSHNISLGHRYIIRPAISEGKTDISFDKTRFIIETILLFVITGGGLYVFKDTKPK